VNHTSCINIEGTHLFLDGLCGPLKLLLLLEFWCDFKVFFFLFLSFHSSLFFLFIVICDEPFNNLKESVMIHATREWCHLRHSKPCFFSKYFLDCVFFCAKFKKNLDSSHYFLTQSSKKKYKLVIKKLLQEYFWQK
jgi:hypothetical protein